MSQLPHPPTGHRSTLRRLLHQPAAVMALAYLLVLALVAVLAPIITPEDPNAQDLDRPFADPLTAGHPLGTDELGRDTLSRLAHATPNAFFAVVVSVSIALAVGVSLGLLAGYAGGRVDFVVMRITDAAQSFPPVIFAIAVVATLGPGLGNTMVALGFLFAPGFLRLTRAVVLDIREEPYIEASRSIGTPARTIVRTRVLPNALPPLVVSTALTAGFVLLAEAGLSFLGLGVQPPDPSWGAMISRGYANFTRQPWLIVFPGVTIGLTVLAFNTLGDGLQKALGHRSSGAVDR
jgi:peptide/nickel transport system permease protein